LSRRAGFTQGEAAHASRKCHTTYRRTTCALVDERKILPIAFPDFRFGALPLFPATPGERVPRVQ